MMIYVDNVRRLLFSTKNRKILSLSSYQIKLLAAFLMVIDHIGAIFFPSVAIWRIIGRLSFPLFAWLLSQGERYTRNFYGYLIRLLLLGLISQPIYYLAFSSTQLNIVFTLSIGLVSLRLGRHFPQYRYFAWGLGVVAAELLQVVYGGYGVLVILFLAQFRSTPIWWFSWCALHALTIFYLGFIQIPALISPLLVYLAGQRRGPSARWFYSFYPLHLLILFLIFRLLN